MSRGSKKPLDISLVIVYNEYNKAREEKTMTKTMERALDVVIRARGFEDEQTIMFANLLENGTIQEEEAMEAAHKVASLPFAEDDEG